MLDRRMLLCAGSATVGAAALAPTASALARAPKAGKQALPSFYRFNLGDSSATSGSGKVAPPPLTCQRVNLMRCAQHSQQVSRHLG
jgi:hypothetical protein